MFLGLVGAAPPAVYRALAGKVAISTTLFLLMIELVGTAMLKFFGISLPVMQVSGGLVLAAMGGSLLSQDEPEPKDTQTGVVDGQILGSLERRIFFLPIYISHYSRAGLHGAHGDFERPRLGKGYAPRHRCACRGLRLRLCC